MVRVHTGQYFDSLASLGRSVQANLYRGRRSILSERGAIATNESKDNVWFVYILKCKNGDLYTGITDNLQRRFEEHASGKGGKFTHAFVAEKLIYSEDYLTKEEALKREAQIKGWTRKKKLVLIKGNLELLKRL